MLTLPLISTALRENDHNFLNAVDRIRNKLTPSIQKLTQKINKKYQPNKNSNQLSNTCIIFENLPKTIDKTQTTDQNPKSIDPTPRQCYFPNTPSAQAPKTIQRKRNHHQMNKLNDDTITNNRVQHQRGV